MYNRFIRAYKENVFMQLIKPFIDKKNFGNKVDIFKSEEGYIVITWDRGAIYYTYVDLEKKKIYSY